MAETEPKIVVTGSAPGRRSAYLIADDGAHMFETWFDDDGTAGDAPISAALGTVLNKAAEADFYVEDET